MVHCRKVKNSLAGQLCASKWLVDDVADDLVIVIAYFIPTGMNRFSELFAYTSDVELALDGVR